MKLSSGQLKNILHPNLFGNKKAVAVDFETNGVYPNSAWPFQISAKRWDGESFENWIGLPDGEVISDKIKNDVCGLKDEDLAKIAVAPGWETIGPEFYAFIADCDVLIAHNGKKYDIPLLLSLEKRVNLSHPNTFPVTLSAIVSSVLDTIEMLDDDRIPWDLRFGGRPTYTSGLYAGKPNRKLPVNYACTHDGADIEDAHQAGYDVDMMLSLMDKIDPIGSIRKSHISEPIQTFGFIYDLATVCHAIPSPGDDVVGAENLVIYYHKKIMASQAISDLCLHDISPLMPHINHVNTDDIPMVTSNYTPPIALMQFFALVICISTLSKGQSQEEKDELYKAFHGIMDGISTTVPDTFVFPYADSSDEMSSSAGFIEGSLFNLLQRAMPTALEKIIRGLLTYNPYGRENMMIEANMAGEKDGDGSFYCAASGLTDPMWCLALKNEEGVPLPFKALLTRHYQDVWVNDRIIQGSFTPAIMCQSPFMIANQHCLTIKYPQFLVMCILARPLRLMENMLFTPLVPLARRVCADILTALNNCHGVGLPKEWYFRRYMAMATHPRLNCLLNSCGSGLFGSDGCVRVKAYLSQSNKAFLEGFGRAVNRELDFGNSIYGLQEAYVKAVATESSPDTRAKYTLEFGEKETIVALLYFGVLDYNRRSQWLGVLSHYILCTASNLEEKVTVKKFLLGLLSYIKKANPS